MTNNTEQKALATLNKTGSLCLLVDRGRRRCQHFGLCSGGAVDAYAWHWANKLIDNNPNSATLEITLGPCDITFSHATRIALCGAEANATLSGRALPPWSSTRVAAGDKLSVKQAKSGLRAYLAIEGGFTNSGLFGSCEPLKENGQPRSLLAGDQFEYPIHTRQKQLNRSAHWQAIPSYTEELILHLHPCYQFEFFSETSIDNLLNNLFSIGANSNRMGYRLEGKPTVWDKQGIMSEGIAFGSVQIPPDGQPIVLLNDRQTIGGYPKIGCVHAADCYSLAQRRPGQKVRFQIKPI
ncbi:biotin-dependent carboxyltransferase family protein [Teredinibacter haidensis]|uniref:5-oxoprolinase subunit C family protein n=1 Tax=Teredinibacter haidensis TaxID=2731755 RepID=UPI000948D72B|nr:biotin-dependent carboxyltransferase family protein [Teredinibacter haidensis]